MNILNIMLLFAVFGLQGASAEEELITGVSPDHSTVVDARQHLMLKIKEKQDVLEELQISSHRRELDHLRTLKDAIALQKDEIHRTQVVLVKELSKHRKQITQENKTITAQLLKKLVTLPDETATRLFAELSVSQRTMLEELRSQHLAMHSETKQVITEESEGIRRLVKEEFYKQAIFDREEFDALAAKMNSSEAATAQNMSVMQGTILRSIEEHTLLLDTLKQVVSSVVASQIKPLHLKCEALETTMRDTQANAAGALTSWAATTGHIIEILKIMASLEKAQTKSFAEQAQTLEQIKDDLKKIKDKPVAAAPVSFPTSLVAAPAAQPAFALGASGTSGRPARRPSSLASTTATPQPPLLPLPSMFGASQKPPAATPATAVAFAAPAEAQVTPMTGIKTLTATAAPAPTTPTTSSAQPAPTKPAPATPVLAAAQPATASFGYKSEGTSQTKPLATSTAAPTATSAQPAPTKPAPATPAPAALEKKSVTFALPTATEQPTTKPAAAIPALAESKTPAPAAAAQKVWTHREAMNNVIEDFPINGMKILRDDCWKFDPTASRGYSNAGKNMGHYQIYEAQ